MNSKTITAGLFIVLVAYGAFGQRIVVDTSSTKKYIITEPIEKVEAPKKEEELSFGDRAMSIGKGILNRLKARLNLEEASESLKDKKDKILGKKEDEPVEEENKEDNNEP